MKEGLGGRYFLECHKRWMRKDGEKRKDFTIQNMNKSYEC